MPYPSDIETLRPDRKRVIEKMVKKLQAYKPQKVILFGSYARNESDDLSDLDLVIIKETGEDFFTRIREVLKLLNYGRAIDVLVYTPEEFKNMEEQGNAFIETIIEEGLVLYGRS